MSVCVYRVFSNSVAISSVEDCNQPDTIAYHPEISHFVLLSRQIDFCDQVRCTCVTDPSMSETGAVLLSWNLNLRVPIV